MRYLRYLCTLLFVKKYRKYIKDCLDVINWIYIYNNDVMIKTGDRGYAPFGLLHIDSEACECIELFDKKCVISSKHAYDLRYYQEPAKIKAEGLDCPVILASVGYGYRFYIQDRFLNSKGFNLLHLLMKEKMRRL
jgi:hypothetical protein